MNQQFDHIRELMAMDKTQAKEKIAENVALINAIIKGEEVGDTSKIAFDNKILSIAAGKANASLLVDVYNAISDSYNLGRLTTAVTGEAKKARTSKVLNINTAATMTAIMKTVIQSGTGRAANIGKPAAGKTGTTDDCKDAYFIGFTPDVVTGVWVGNDDNSKMGELTGGTVPAKIWRDVMLVATQPYGNSDFKYPEIMLKPFKAPSVSVIPQAEALKAWQEEDEREAKEAEKEAEKAEKAIEKAAEKAAKEAAKVAEKAMKEGKLPIIKPDSIKPVEVAPQVMPSIKKEQVKTIEVKQERTEPVVEQFAPVPLDLTPMGG
jgi:membrane carboxypeptidase/penicillin-binding protein